MRFEDRQVFCCTGPRKEEDSPDPDANGPKRRMRMESLSNK